MEKISFVVTYYITIIFLKQFLKLKFWGKKIRGKLKKDDFGRYNDNHRITELPRSKKSIRKKKGRRGFTDKSVLLDNDDQCFAFTPRVH